MFGYITTDIPNLQRYSHVFSAENKEKASEILTAICKGYKEGASKAASKDTHSLRKSSHKKSSHDIELRESKKASNSQEKENRSSRSDQLVTRMKNFFQGTDTAVRSYSISHKKLNKQQSEARRKRGGSMDNLIDSIETTEKMTKISQDTKKKCSSIKNLSFGSLKTKDDQKEVKITSV